MKNLLVSFGTRPEVIKLAPIVTELKTRDDLSVVVCNTEQQKELSRQAMSYFGLKSDICLDVMTYNQTLTSLQCRMMERLELIFNQNHYDGVLVQGDTMTVLATSLVAFYNKVPIFHIEAGLRTDNLYSPFPEEGIRRLVSRLAMLNFAPTKRAKQQLLNEGISSEKILVTGNTSIDAIKQYLQSSCGHQADSGIRKNPKVLITVHRRENHGSNLQQIILAIKKLSEIFHFCQFIWPVHPNPNVRIPVERAFNSRSNVHLVDPMDYPKLVETMSSVALILTDSGGIQEEATLFNIPILVLRDTTERQEGVESGHAFLVGTDVEKIIETTSYFLNGGRLKLAEQFPYGDGTASIKIANEIAKFLFG